MSRITIRTGGVLLVLLAVLWVAPPVHADVIGAFQDYKKGDYPRAFQEFLALAELGQPLAQFDVATMYYAGQGTPASATDAYAWATLAAANGEANGKKLADEIRPHLPPASEQAAASVIACSWMDRSRRRETRRAARRRTHAPASPGSSRLRRRESRWRSTRSLIAF